MRSLSQSRLNVIYIFYDNIYSAFNLKSTFLRIFFIVAYSILFLVCMLMYCFVILNIYLVSYVVTGGRSWGFQTLNLEVFI